MTILNVSSQFAAINFTDAQFEAKCIEITGTHCLHWLQAWCAEHQIGQSTWERLYFNLCSYIQSQGRYRSQPQVFCCINETILEQESQSIDICKRIGWELRAITGGYEIYQDNELIDNVFALSIGYRTKRSRACGAADPYTAALDLLTTEIIQDLALSVHRDRLEINLAITSKD